MYWQQYYSDDNDSFVGMDAISKSSSNVNVLQLSKDFGQASSRRDKHFSSFAKVKLSPRLPPSIVPLDYSAINTSCIGND